MKKIIVYAAGLLLTLSAAAAPGAKIIKAFQETFPNAENVKWNDDKAGYFVSFYQGGNFEKVLYSKSGDFVCSWKYSDGQDLPVNIVMKLNKRFGEHNILGVTELATNDNTSYEIKLAKHSKWYSVTALANGEIIREEKFNDQSGTTE
jgi:hypothetical protein